MEVTKQTRLHYEQTESSKWKKKALENVYDLFSDLESDEDDKAAGGRPSSAATDEEAAKAQVEGLTYLEFAFTGHKLVRVA